MARHAINNDQLDHIKSTNLNQINNDVDKLYHAAADFQQELLQLYADGKISVRAGNVRSTLNEETKTPNKNLTEKPPFWSGLQWIPAERDYSTDAATMEPSCSVSSHMDVLVYDCSVSKLEVWSGLKALQRKRALFAKLPSRWCSEVQVCVEKITRTEAKHAPRYDY
ncbi:hypothetical protein F5B20DRAFT_223328 [Whalleya microplaca]|nr:hypothetical protein F5B20DRAFT_223328 [Whalleya microplaca]